MTSAPTRNLEQSAALLDRVRQSVSQYVVGQEATVHDALVAYLARGHVLIEGVPGTAKTLLVRALAAALGLRFSRIQFTPDLMPSDVTGVNVLRDPVEGFEFQPGPVFTDLLLGDEINRAPAKTQSALLEAMAERQVTVDGVSRPLGDAFTVFATQNPVEHEGTYPLPEAQLDRFLVKTVMPYPTREAELELLARYEGGFDAERLVAAEMPSALDAAEARGDRDSSWTACAWRPRCASTSPTSRAPRAKSGCSRSAHRRARRSRCSARRAPPRCSRVATS